MRTIDSEAAGNASFKIRATNKFKPNISEMKNTATQRNFRKTDIGVTSNAGTE